MNATISFDLPKENVELSCALRGADWKSVVCEVDMYLRNLLKYGGEDIQGTPAEVLQRVRNYLHEETDFRNLALDE